MKNKIDFKKITEKIVSIEEAIDVNSFKFEGICIWPFIRIRLWGKLRRLYLAKRESRTSMMHLFIDKFVFLAVASKSLLFSLKSIRRIKKVGKTDILFISKPNPETTNCKNRQFYDIYIDPFIEMIRKRNSFIKLEIREGKAVDIVEYNIAPCILDISWVRIKTYFRSLVKRHRVPNLGNFFRLLSSHIESECLDETHLAKNLHTIISLEKLFSKLLGNLKPKAVFLVNYEYLPAMSMVLSCRQNGIPVIDVQHGKQGRYNCVYTHWTKIPENGYQLLPDYFWVWGEETRKNIQDHQPEGIKKNLPVVGGNLWLSKWLHDDIIDFVGSKELEFEKFLSKYSKKILVTLQPIDEAIPEHLLKAMKSSPASWVWMIRVHPIWRHKISVIEKFLLENGVKNYEIIKSSNIFLYFLLDISDHHITCWSSVCYEALYFHVSTTIIHPSGADLYKDYISKNIFAYAGSADEIIRSVSEMDSRSAPKEEFTYIETNRDISRNLLDSLIGNK